MSDSQIIGSTTPSAEQGLSQRLLDARRNRRTVAAPATLDASFDVDAAYRVARLNYDALIARGERAVGRKIGFTNRTIWDEYKVYQPIWAHMYASTVHDLNGGDVRCPTRAFCQPRIEPEIMVKFARAPAVAEPGAIAECIEWVAHGYEIVDCNFPDWKFVAADTVADFGLHGALFVGAPVAPADIPEMVDALSTFRVELYRDGTLVDRGIGSNVLDGPLQALAHLMRVLATQDNFAPIAAGEIITTGTLTGAWPVAAGEHWQTRLHGIALPGASLHFT